MESSCDEKGKPTSTTSTPPLPILHHPAFSPLFRHSPPTHCSTACFLLCQISSHQLGPTPLCAAFDLLDKLHFTITHKHIRHAKVYYSHRTFIYARMTHCSVSSQSLCVCVCASKSGGPSISAWGSACWRCDGGDAKAQFESFLDSVVFITSAQLSGIDSINSRNDLMSQTCRQHAGIRSQLALLQTYNAAEK